MNTKQLSDWNQLVRQCKTQCARRPYNSINISSTIRSEAIVAADALVELVTPELADLLEHLATWTKADDSWSNSELKRFRREIVADCAQARATAARIREALEGDDAQKEQVEMLETGGGWLARVRREKTE